MPLSRYKLRNEYGLGDENLYKNADRDDSEAMLEGVAMAGLVGILRHLGDLAQFAAEVFHDLHEEVMATTARGHCLITRVQQLEAEFPIIEKTFLTETNHTSFLYKSGVDWHPNLRIDQNMVTRRDLPRFLMDSYEECRGPPRFFLLDKFDVAGPGACLKRYTDPSFVKTASIPSNGRTSERQREKKTRRVKKQAPRWRKGDTPESFPSSHAKLHQLFLEERLESDGTDPECRVKLKKRQFTGSFLDQENKTSYMEKLLDMSPAEQKSVATTTDGCEVGLEIVEIGTVSPTLNEVMITDKSLHLSPNSRELEMKPSMDDVCESKGNETIHDEVNGENSMDIESNSQVSVDDGLASEMENYADAMATVESEVEVDSGECRKISCYLNAKPPVADFCGSEVQGEPQSLFSDSQSLGNSTTSEDYNNRRENSSCSTSGNSMTESTTDSEAHALVTNVPASKSDHDELSFELHHPSKGIPGNETEEQARASNGVVEEFPKSTQYSGELSNISCLTGLNNELTGSPVGKSANDLVATTSDAIYPETMNQTNFNPNVASLVSSTRENSFAEKPDSNAVFGATDEAGEECPGNSFSNCEDSVSIDENRQDSFLDAGSLQRDFVLNNITHGHQDQSEPSGTDSHLEFSCDASSSDTPSEAAISSNSALAAENNSTMDHNTMKVEEHTEIAANGSKEIDAEKDLRENFMPVSSSEFLYAEKLKDLPVSQTDSFYQNEDGLVQERMVDSSSFPALDMFPAEPPITLEPPPLPPLPPMQWRLGKFQNSPKAKERQVLRHTQGSVSPVACSDVSSQNDIIGTGGENNCSFSASQTSVTSQNGDQTLENSCQPSVNPLGSESRDDAHVSGSCQTVEDGLCTEVDNENGQPEHVPQVTEQEAMNSNGDSNGELPHLSTELNNRYTHPGFVSSETGSMLLSAHERVPMNTNGNANGTVQSKLQRPRNPLIDEVVAVDKSKLRKVEQVKPPVDSKVDEGESLLEQLQLRKVGERNKLLVESKTEEIGLLMEQLQLRKVGERVKPGTDPREEETESPCVQLRKVVGRSASMVGPKIEDRDSLLEQIRNKSFNLRPAAMARPLVHGGHGPRTNLRVAAILQKASNIRQAMAGSDEEDDADSWSDC